MKEKLEAQAQLIISRINDHQGSIGFHIRVIQKLGFQKCYELTSYVLEKKRTGKIKGTTASYYNGCVQREIVERKCQ